MSRQEVAQSEARKAPAPGGPGINGIGDVGGFVVGGETGGRTGEVWSEVRPRQARRGCARRDRDTANGRERGTFRGNIGRFRSARIVDEHTGSFPRREAVSRLVHGTRDAGGISAYA